MKRFSLGSVAVAALVTSGTASADEFNIAKDWTGAYVGANAGYVWGDADTRTSTQAGTYFAGSSVSAVNSSGVAKVHPDGFTGGAQAGFNWQSGNVVFGVEGDFDAYDLNESRTVTTLYPAFAPSTFTLHQAVNADWLLTLRPRVGYAANNLLAYVTGGLAVTELKNSNSFSDTFGLGAAESSSASKTKYGWALGAGLEYAVTSNWSAKAEYLYTDFGSMTSSGVLTASGPSSAPFSHAADLNSSIVRIGVNYTF